ncbi:MAG: serine/threonine protein kinase, partial [Sedimentisphaerales bacterium]|nr:serine/threonine protein kinase [Sedimentisphaerales bacterium]
SEFLPPEPAELARQFPQLDILELLGQGGMGAVYKARQRQLDRLVALKILSPQLVQDAAFAERFVREARSLARQNHPRIISVYDFGKTEAGLFYFIMEFIDGTDLRRVIQAGQLSPPEALAIVPQICEALQYAHDEGIVHRDIKPENILLDKKGRVKIADFGLAKLLGRPASVYTLTRAGQRMGTPHYMAPEQIEHPHQVDHRADIYSLGVVFYEMLTGELPLGRFPPPSQKVYIDVRLDEVVLKTLEKEPQRRYQHASEVKTDVETISSTSPSVEPSAEKIVKPANDTESMRQRVWVPAVGLLVSGGINCLAVVGAIIVALVTLIQHGFSGQLVTFGFLPGAIKVSIITAMSVPGALVLMGGWNLMQLRSHRWALAGSIAALVPFFPGALLGIPMGIWALVLMNKDEVKRSFGQKQTKIEVPPKVRDFAVSTAESVKEAFGSGKAEVEKILREERISPDAPGTAQPVPSQRKTRPTAIGSFVLGLVSIVFASAGLGFASKFTLVFLSAFFAIFLGVTTIKLIKSYRDHLLDAALAIAGIAAAAISGVGLLARATG